jgi:hypothetical protein
MPQRLSRRDRVSLGAICAAAALTIHLSPAGADSVVGAWGNPDYYNQNNPNYTPGDGDGGPGGDALASASPPDSSYATGGTGGGGYDGNGGVGGNATATGGTNAQALGGMGGGAAFGDAADGGGASASGYNATAVGGPGGPAGDASNDVTGNAGDGGIAFAEGVNTFAGGGGGGGLYYADEGSAGNGATGTSEAAGDSTIASVSAIAGTEAPDYYYMGSGGSYYLPALHGGNGGNGGNGAEQTAEAGGGGGTLGYTISASATGGYGGDGGGIYQLSNEEGATLGNGGYGAMGTAIANGGLTPGALFISATALGGAGGDSGTVGGLGSSDPGFAYVASNGGNGAEGAATANGVGEGTAAAYCTATATGGKGGTSEGGFCGDGGFGSAGAGALGGTGGAYATAIATGGIGGLPVMIGFTGDSGGVAGINGGALATAAATAPGPVSASATANGSTATATATAGFVIVSEGGGDFKFPGGRLLPADETTTTLTVQQCVSATNGTATAYVAITSSQISLGTSGQTDNEGTLTLSGAGSLSINGITGGGSLVVGDGTNAMVLTLLSNSGVSTQTSIQINAGSSLDIRNNSVIVNYGSGADPVATIKSYLSSAYDGGAWDQPGVTSSSVVAANGGSLVYSIGYADGADGVVSGLTSGQIEIMPTLAGDATLSGTVDFGDYQIFDAHYGHSGSWDQGNFKYTSTINFGDYGLIAQNYGYTASLTEAELSAMQQFASQFGDALVPNADGVGFQLVSVPEPAMATTLAAIGAASLARRRRRRR